MKRKLVLLGLLLAAGCNSPENLTSGKHSGSDAVNTHADAVRAGTHDNRVTELERLFDRYSDTLTEITVANSVMTVFLKEQIPQRKTVIDLAEIEAIDYVFVDGNPDYPHQVVLECPGRSNCLKAFLYYRDNSVISETNAGETYMFTDKKAALRVREILRDLKKTGL